jgi:hypothetical protein
VYKVEGLKSLKEIKEALKVYQHAVEDKPKAEPKKLTVDDLPAKVRTLIDDLSFLEKLNNLRQRWVDEREYEDWKDYEKIIRNLFDAYGFRAFVVTKRPFGGKFLYEGVEYCVQLKLKGEYAHLNVRWVPQPTKVKAEEPKASGSKRNDFSEWVDSKKRQKHLDNYMVQAHNMKEVVRILKSYWVNGNLNPCTFDRLQKEIVCTNQRLEKALEVLMVGTKEVGRVVRKLEDGSYALEPKYAEQFFGEERKAKEAKVAAKRKAKKAPAKKAPTKKKVAKKAGEVNTNSRAPGLTFGLGVEKTWVKLFEQNEKCKKAERMTDEQITEFMYAEFPHKTCEVFKHVNGVRGKYNRGGFHKGEAPELQSKRYDENGDVLVGRATVSQAKKAPAAPAKKAPAKKATKKVAKKKVAKKAAKKK